jgi:hypothetical protein
MVEVEERSFLLHEYPLIDQNTIYQLELVFALLYFTDKFDQLTFILNFLKNYLFEYIQEFFYLH